MKAISPLVYIERAGVDLGQLQMVEATAMLEKLLNLFFCGVERVCCSTPQVTVP
jgi:hypothetical protein